MFTATISLSTTDIEAAAKVLTMEKMEHGKASAEHPMHHHAEHGKWETKKPDSTKPGAGMKPGTMKKPETTKK